MRTRANVHLHPPIDQGSAMTPHFHSTHPHSPTYPQSLGSERSDLTAVMAAAVTMMHSAVVVSECLSLHLTLWSNLIDHFYPYYVHQGPPSHLAGSHLQALTQQQQQMLEEWLTTTMNFSYMSNFRYHFFLCPILCLF